MCNCNQNLRTGSEESSQKTILEDIKELTTIKTTVELETGNIALTVAICTVIVLVGMFLYKQMVKL